MIFYAPGKGLENVRAAGARVPDLFSCTKEPACGKRTASFVSRKGS
jgi:hypothetical protein